MLRWCEVDKSFGNEIPTNKNTSFSFVDITQKQKSDIFNIKTNFWFDSIVIHFEWVGGRLSKRTYPTIENYSTVLVLLLELNIKQ